MKRIIDLLKSLLGLQLNSVEAYVVCESCGKTVPWYVNETQTFSSGDWLRQCPNCSNEIILKLGVQKGNA